MSRLILRLTLLLSLLCSSSLARADSPGVELDPDTEIARRHFFAGSAAYEKGDYVTALQEFERARLVKPLPDLDYNIGRCHDRLEQYPQAIAAYQRFLDATKNDGERSEIRARIEQLRARQRQLEPARPVAAPTPMPALAVTTVEPTPRERALHPYRGPIALGALSVGLLAVGFGLYGSVGGDYDALKSSCSPACAPSRWNGLQERERAGAGLAIAGGALAVADVAWFVIAARRRPPVPPARPLSSHDLSVSVGSVWP